MADQLNRIAKRIVQRTSANTGQLRSESERAAFSNNVRADLASILEQLNSVYYPLISALMSEQSLNALDYGLSGNVIKTHINASAASATAYWNTNLSRARTIKETIDVLLAEIARLEGLISQLGNVLEYDDSEIFADLADVDLNLRQLAKDTMGAAYVFDGDGNANLTYSLGQALDALGGLVTGWPGTGLTHAGTYPTLTIPQSSITDLGTDFAAIRTFVGMDNAADNSPDYSAYGPLLYVADGDPLEEAIWKLDDALANYLPVFPAYALLFGDGTNVPIVDSLSLVWDNPNNRLGIGTNTPEKSLDVRGVIQHVNGVISRGGNARGTDASDLQVVRAAATQVASGQRSVLLGGQNNTASGADSMAGGLGNIASATAAVAIGTNTLASAQSSFAHGDSAAATAAYAEAGGYYSAAGLTAQRALASGMFATPGDAQMSDIVTRISTDNVGPYETFIDGDTATLRIVLSNNTSYSFVTSVIARSSTGLTNHYVLEGTIKRGAGAGTTTLVGAVAKRIIAEEVVAADANLVADNVNGAAVIQVTGVLGELLRWVASSRITQVAY